MYVLDTTTGVMVPYDDTFKSYATIKFVQSSGTTGEFAPCGSAIDAYKSLIDQPEIKASSISNTLCMPIDFAVDIQAGNIDV